ncbi:hypothetical protein MBRA1_002306 [Malassezia brasiliensis]|uniref:Calcineurin-like phosphoesterase domain-containing protein n=1 Tax=Malassezia brasiliensis TaxID=1821822 RepID=A0AAF0DTA8_9BASI|nr:hypothetical protein MBRA1_002306 [Malassezia brasiliensis]
MSWRRRVGLVLVALLGAYVLFASHAEVHERRLVAVADLHGDYAHALAVLRNARILAPESTDWVAGDTVLVSTGDSVDRGDDTIQLYELYLALQKQSAAAGGRVVNLLGNHEMMNALHDWRYVTPGDVRSFGGAAARRHAMSIDGWIGAAWLDTYNVTATVALPLPAGMAERPPAAVQATFVHGGLTPAWAKVGTEAINALGHAFLQKALADPDPRGGLPFNTTPAEAALWSADGPFWYRGYAVDGAAAACATARKAMHALDAQYLVMGHTPSLQGFQVRCDGQVYVIDTGISRAYGGRQSALEITTRYERRRTWGRTRHTLAYAFAALYVGAAPERLHVHEVHW